MTDTMALTKDDFCARFVTEMMKAASFFDGTEAELRAYAEEIASTYFDDKDQRDDGPEACAEADISYWDED